MNSDHSKFTAPTRCCVIVLSMVICSTTADFDVTSVATALDDVDNPTWYYNYLSFVSQTNDNVYLYDNLMDGVKKMSLVNHTPDGVAFVVPITHSDAYAIGFDTSMSGFQWDGTSNDLVDFGKNIAFDLAPNENLIAAITDERRRLWVVTDQGSIYGVDENGAVHRELSGLGALHGIAFSAFYTKFYRADATNRVIVEHDFNNNDGKISESSSIFFNFTAKNVDGKPGGMAVDTMNYLWVACTGTYNIIKINPKTGNVLKSVTISLRVSSVAFGGPLLDILFVTTDGGLFKVTDTGSIGREVKPYKLFF